MNITTGDGRGTLVEGASVAGVLLAVTEEVKSVVVTITFSLVELFSLTADVVEGSLVTAVDCLLSEVMAILEVVSWLPGVVVAKLVVVKVVGLVTVVVGIEEVVSLLRTTGVVSEAVDMGSDADSVTLCCTLVTGEESVVI